MKVLWILMILLSANNAFSRTCKSQIDSFIEAQTVLSEEEFDNKIESSIVAEDVFTFAKALNQMTAGNRTAITSAIENATMSVLSVGSGIAVVIFYPSHGDHNYWCRQGIELIVLDSKSCATIHQQHEFDCK
jgi:hypothetical protein